MPRAEDSEPERDRGWQPKAPADLGTDPTATSGAFRSPISSRLMNSYSDFQCMIGASERRYYSRVGIIGSI